MIDGLTRRNSNLAHRALFSQKRVCQQYKAINLGQGLGDLLAPLPVREAARNVIGNGADTDHEIVVTSGATAALASTLQALLDPGASVLLSEAFYGYHLNTIVIAGLEPHFVELPLPSVTLTEAALRAAAQRLRNFD